MSKTTTRMKLMVQYLVWAKKDRIFWYHDDKKITAKRLDEARDFAKKHNYDGIQIVPAERNWHE